MKSKQVSIIAGGVGFIGTNLLQKLVQENRSVVVIDNFSRGKLSHISALIKNKRVDFIHADLADREQCKSAFKKVNELSKIQEVWHLAANSDIPAGIEKPDVDLKDTFLTTLEILRVMKEYNIPDLYFASSSAVYGDFGNTLLHENIGPLLPISNYGAMKLASEALISAAIESYLERAVLFRFPNVVGVPATHGVILDFFNKLRKTPDELQVLGNGTQQKAYLHVSDLISAMLTIRAAKPSSKVDIVNIGPIDEGVTVKWIAEQVVARINPRARIVFGEGNKGWVGDVPKFSYSTAKLQKYGWCPSLNSAAAILKAIDEITTQFA